MRRLVTMIFAMAVTLGFPAAGAADVPADWIEVAAGPMFTVKAPPGTTFERTRDRRRLFRNVPWCGLRSGR